MAGGRQKNKAGKRDRKCPEEGWWGGCHSKDLGDHMTLKLRSKEARRLDIWDKSIPCRGNREGKGSESGAEGVGKRIAGQKAGKGVGS